MNTPLVLAKSTIYIDNNSSGERIESRLTVFPTPSILQPQEAWEQLPFQSIGSEQLLASLRTFTGSDSPYKVAQPTTTG